MYEIMTKNSLNYFTVPRVDSTLDCISDYTKNVINASEETKCLTLHNRVFSLRFSEDGADFFVGLANGDLQMRNAENGNLIYTFHSQTKGDLMALATGKKHHVNYVFSGNIAGEMYVTNSIRRKHDIFAHERGNEVNTIDVNTNLDCLLAAGKDAAVRVYDVKTAKLLFKFCEPQELHCTKAEKHYHTMRVMAVKFQPRSADIFVTGGRDGELKIWDLRVKYGLVKNIPGPRILGEAIVFYKSDIITGSFRLNKGLQRWDIGTGKLIRSINMRNRSKYMNGSFLTCVQLLDFHKSGSHLIVGGPASKSLDVVNMNEESRIAKINTGFPIRSIANRKGRIIVGSFNHLINCVTVY